MKISEQTYKKLDAKIVVNEEYIRLSKEVDLEYSRLQEILMELEPFIGHPNINLILDLVDNYVSAMNGVNTVVTDIYYRQGYADGKNGGGK